jgi:hypothetical protein
MRLSKQIVGVSWGAPKSVQGRHAGFAEDLRAAWIQQYPHRRKEHTDVAILLFQR